MKTLSSERDLNEVLQRLRTLRLDSKRRWGKMTVQQMVCHLSDSFRAVTGQMTVSAATGPLQRTVVKWVALYAPMPWPPGLPTRPELDQRRDAGTRPGEFAADVEELARLTSRFAVDQLGCARPEHPIFGLMSHRDWMRWGYLHMDHHLRQFSA
jgi:DinB family protein